MDFEQQHESYRHQCEQALTRLTKELFEVDSRVSEAAEYSLTGGGKRVRGVLTLATCDLLRGDMHAAATAAAAIEMVHAFSLVHDDLPCMDDDDMRRGKPSCHVIYGQANALLAGDLLAIEAFEALSGGDLPPQMAMCAVKSLSAASGARGMIYGQELDLKYEQETANETALRKIQRHKTGALISAAVELGAITAEKEPGACKNLMKYAENIGYTFQIVDDILDVQSTNEVLGKPVGSDVQQGKTTFVALNGLEKSQIEVKRLTKEAIEVLQQKYGEKTSFLCEYASRLANRIS